MTGTLASRRFEAADQLEFAAFSGDYNPMHMDPVLARRMEVGTPVVHGMHVLLWLLDNIGAANARLPPICSVKAQFKRAVHLGEMVEVRITRLDDTELHAEASVHRVVALELGLRFGSVQPARAPVIEGSPSVLQPSRPQVFTIEELAGYSGYLAFASDAEVGARLFPNAARIIGARRVAAFGCATFVVGMVIPGLYSIFAGLSLDICDSSNNADRIAFSVTATDRRFRIVRLQIAGGGICGTLETFVRNRPVQQPSMNTLAQLVGADEFSGATALVVGGSRGLGELTAKIIAAGNGSVIVTYAAGKADAEAVVAEIAASGHEATARRLDVREGPDEFFAALRRPPTHIYYFATPPIALPKLDGISISIERFDYFNRFYVSGLLELITAARQCCPRGVKVFCPSSVFVTDCPVGMAEYAMSKAASEQLCEHINSRMSGVYILTKRLPRLATDQTLTVVPVRTQDAVEVMLPIIRTLQSG